MPLSKVADVATTPDVHLGAKDPELKILTVKSTKHTAVLVLAITLLSSVMTLSQTSSAQAAVQDSSTRLCSAGNYALLGSPITLGANAIAHPNSSGAAVGISGANDALAMQDLSQAISRLITLSASGTNLQTTELSTDHSGIFPLGTFGAGVYSTAAALNTVAGSTITLDGGGLSDSKFYFLVGNAITFGAGTKIALINGASAGNVYFVAGIGAGDMTIGAGSMLLGNYIINGAATFGAAVHLSGRLLASAAVTLGADVEIYGLPSEAVCISAEAQAAADKVIADKVVADKVVADNLLAANAAAASALAAANAAAEKVIAGKVIADNLLAANAAAASALAAANAAAASALAAANAAAAQAAALIPAPIVIRVTQPTPVAVAAPVAAQVISATNAVATKAITMQSGGLVAVSIQSPNGISMPVTVSVPANASTKDLTISVSSSNPVLEPLSGFVNIKITAITSDNVYVTQFEKPLTINLGKLDPTAAIAYSSDGFTWKNIAQLSGTDLPASSGEGYYIAANGEVVILTHHLTSFGTKVAPIPLEITTKENVLTVGEDFTVDVIGIMGDGHVWFDSTTPEICDVTSLGKVHSYKTGDCYIMVAVAANGDFMDAYSEPQKFHISAAVVAPEPAVILTPVVTPTPTVSVSKMISSIYFTKNTSALDHNAYLALTKLLTSLKAYKTTQFS